MNKHSQNITFLDKHHDILQYLPHLRSKNEEEPQDTGVQRVPCENVHCHCTAETSTSPQVGFSQTESSLRNQHKIPVSLTEKCELQTVESSMVA